MNDKIAGAVAAMASTSKAEPLLAFPPLVDERSRLLILGSMPSAESLRRQEYYAHPRNAFWPIIHDLWGQPTPVEYEQRTGFLLDHELALWDVLASCHRIGSADSAIREAVANDFAAFFRTWPNLHWICFNGRTAAGLFERFVLQPQGCRTVADLRPDLTVYRLGSTSPAHAIPYEKRLADWRLVKVLLETT